MYEFNTPEPVNIRIEFGAGDITIDARETSTTHVELTADREDEASARLVAETRIEQRGGDIVVEVPRHSSSFMRRSPSLTLRMVVPAASSLEAKTGSADLRTAGELSAARVGSGSGDIELDVVTGDAEVKTGSGDVRVEQVEGDVRINTGSGDVDLRQGGGSVTVSTASGDARVDSAKGRVQANTASGDVQLGDVGGDVNVNTASGDMQIGRVSQGRLKANSASGDVHVGVAHGTAAWLDVHTVSGSVRSSLDGGEAPAEGELSVELRVNTVSGDISITHA
ncbi:MAG: DUF4097 family beta strand repeat-containing protein [Nocardioidaceae bacterium]